MKSGIIRVAILSLICFPGNLQFGIGQEQSSGKNLIIDLETAVKTAILNNPTIKSKQNHIEVQKATGISLLPLGETDFSYQQGQINSSVNDTYYEIGQSFGKPLSIPARAKQVKLNVHQTELEYELTINQVVRDVKHGWYEWITAYQKMLIVGKQHDAYKKLFEISKLKNDLGEISRLERSYLETSWTRSKLHYINAISAYHEAYNKLSFKIFSTDSLVPSGEILSLVQIQHPGLQDSMKTLNRLYQIEYQKSVQDHKVQKWNLTPEISVGYFNQQIDGVGGFEGWQAGLAIPVFNAESYSSIKQAKYLAEMKKNDAGYLQQNLNYEINSLRNRLDALFAQYIAFESDVLANLQDMLDMAELKYQKQDIEYLEFIQIFDHTISMNIEYLDVIKSYNQTAVMLEYYLK